MRCIGTIIFCAFFLATSVCAQTEAEELAAARQVFEANLEAIRQRDRSGYLNLYWRSEKLARTGPEGVAYGFDAFEKTAGSNWPDTFEGRDLQLMRVRPGVVYGTYRYRVRYGAEEHSGVSERLFLSTPAGWKIAMTSAFDAPAGTPPPPLALVGATLIDGRGGVAVRDSLVVIRNGRIDCAGRCEVPANVTAVDVKGKWITPGIIDAHVHFSQSGWADGRPDSIDVRDRYPYERTQAQLKLHPERFFQSYLCSGVTGVFDVGGYPWTIALTEAVEANTRAPHLAAAGPLLSTLDHWVNLPAERQFIHLQDESSVGDSVRYLAAQGADAFKVWYIVSAEQPAASTAPLIRAAAAAARQHQVPLIVHATGLQEARIAVSAGAHVLVHSVWDQPVDGEFIDLLKKNGTIYIPTLTVLRNYVRMNESAHSGQPLSIDDPNRCVDSVTRAKLAETPSLKSTMNLTARTVTVVERERTMAANLKRLHDAGVRIAMGTDAGNPLTLHGPSIYAEMEAMQRAGLTPMQVLVASTRGGAAAMRRETDLGTLEKGKVADLLVLDADPTTDIANLRKLGQVMRGGVLRSIEELSAVASK